MFKYIFYKYVSSKAYPLWYHGAHDCVRIVKERIPVPHLGLSGFKHILYCFFLFRSAVGSNNCRVFIYILLFVFSLQGKKRLGVWGLVLCVDRCGQCFIITLIAGGSFSKEKPTGFANWIFELLSLVLFRTMCTLVMLIWGVLFGSMVLTLDDPILLKLDEFKDVYLIVPPSARWRVALHPPLWHCSAELSVTLSDRNRISWIITGNTRFHWVNSFFNSLQSSCNNTNVRELGKRDNVYIIVNIF